MKEKNNKSHLVWWVWGMLTLLVPLALALIFWNQMPEKIPTHWNIYGEADDYSNKTSGVIFISLLNVGLYLLFWLLPKIDPKRNFDKFNKPYRWIIFSITTFISILHCFVILQAAGFQFSMSKAMLTIILILLIIVGNFLGKLRPNYFVGIRTPWTIENETVWVKTHRLGGRIWVSVALLTLILLFVTNLSFVILIPMLIIMVVVPLVYSYILYKQIPVSNRIGGML